VGQFEYAALLEERHQAEDEEQDCQCNLWGDLKGPAVHSPTISIGRVNSQSGVQFGAGLTRG
jgi:hypothetical protein